MKNQTLRGILLSGLFVLIAPCAAQAQNNTAATAASYVVNEGWINVDMGAAPNTQRWYLYSVYAGRSYCVEGRSERTPTGGNDGETTVYRSDGTTLIGRADDNRQEPGGGEGLGGTNNPGRVCYIALADEENFMRVGNFNLSPTVHSYRWRVVETTQFCPWFFSGSGFEAFILLKNTTNVPIRAKVNLRDTAGTILGTQTGTVPANGSFNLQVSDPAGFNLVSASGSVEIAYGTDTPFGITTHNTYGRGGPGGLIANVTSLSFTGGVSFDTPAAPRQDWQR